MGRKTKYYKSENRRLVKNFSKLSAADVWELKDDEARKLLSEMRKQYELRAQQHIRASNQSSKYYSPAYEGMEKFKKKSTYTDKPVNELTNAQVKGELSRLNQFYTSETATVTGARSVMKDQDKRIFGESKSGNAKYSMTAKQREIFWKVYEEASKSAGMASQIARMYSMQKNGQEILGAVIRKTSEENLTFENLYQRFQNVLNQYEDLSYGKKVKNRDPALALLRGTRNDWYDSALE